MCGTFVLFFPFISIFSFPLFFSFPLYFFSKVSLIKPLQNSIINSLVILNPALKTLCLISQARYQFSTNLKFTNVGEYESKNVCNIWSLFQVFIYASLLKCTFQMWATASLWNIYRKDADTLASIGLGLGCALPREAAVEAAFLWTF